MHDAAIVLGADHAARGLYDLAQAGNQIRVVEARAVERVHARAHRLVHGVHLRHAERRDERADEARARQVDALAERAAQYREADTAAALCKARDEGLLAGFVHGARLPPDIHLRVARRERVGGLLEILVAAEKAQIVAGTLGILRGHARHECVERTLAVLIARRDLARDVHVELLGAKRRLDVDAHRVVRQAEHVGVVVRGRERGRKERETVRRRDARAQGVRRDDVADRERRARAARALARHRRHVEERMGVETLGDAREVQGVEIKALQLGVAHERGFGELIAYRADHVAERRNEAFGQGVARAPCARLHSVLRVPVLLQTRERALERRARRAAHGVDARLHEFCRVHRAGALGQVVRLVHEHARAPLVVRGEHEQHCARVEPVVVVADDHVAPARELLAEVIGAYGMHARHFAQRRAIESHAFERRRARRRQSIVEPACERARFAVARRFGMLASLLARNELEHAQGQRGTRRIGGGFAVGAGERGEGVQRQLASRAFRAQEHDLVDPGARAGLQLGKQRADGLADARWRLREQAPPLCGRAPDGFGEFALAVSKRRMRQAQRGECGVSVSTMGGLLVGPCDEAAALRLERGAQLRGARVFDERRLAARTDVVVHEREFERVEAELFAQKRPVHAQLRPVQRTLVFAHCFEVAAIGLELFEPAACGVVAVGAAAHRQRFECAGQRDFGLVARRAPRGDGGVAGAAIARVGRRREAHVEVAAFGGELAQRAHGDGVAHGARNACAADASPGDSGQRTCKTETGIRCCTQYASQRRWLSCRRSPGPFTSISS